jgi:hypothetical protein
MGLIRSKKADTSTELELLSGWQVSPPRPATEALALRGTNPPKEK